jgi:azurin
MKKLIYNLCLLGTCTLLWHCSQPDPHEADTLAASEETTQEDTAGASAPVVEEQDTTQQQVEELTLRALGNTLDEIAYSEDTLEVKAGALVKLTFINEGMDMPMVHNVVFTAPDKYKQVALAGAKIGSPGNYIPEGPSVIAATPIALPGQTVQLEFTAPTEPGEYDFVCTYPEHFQKMHGTLLVK